MTPLVFLSFLFPVNRMNWTYGPTDGRVRHLMQPSSKGRIMELPLQLWKHCTDRQRLKWRYGRASVCKHTLALSATLPYLTCGVLHATQTEPVSSNFTKWINIAKKNSCICALMLRFNFCKKMTSAKIVTYGSLAARWQNGTTMCRMMAWDGQPSNHTFQLLS